VAVAAFFPHRSSAQITYNDFNAPATAPASPTSTACLPNSAPAGVLFCLNYGALETNGISLIQDTYPPSIDPNASADGDSGSINYALQLTQNAGSEDSSVWYSIPQDVVDGFDLWYATKINYAADPSVGHYFTADGMAFVIQNAAGGATDSITNSPETGSGLTVLGSGGGALGYGGIDNSVALEMDTFYDAPIDPYDNLSFFTYDAYADNHMALQSCGAGNPNSPAHLGSPNCLITLGTSTPVSTLVSNPYTSAAPPTAASAVILADGNPHQVVIKYNGRNESPKNYISVYLDPAFNPGTHTPVAGSVPLFAGEFDITQYIKLSNGGPPYSPAYIGFTAGTGGDYEQHEVMGFSFTPHGYATANVCPSGQTTPAPCSTTIPVTFDSLSGAAIGSVQVVTQGTTGLDFQLAGGSGTCTGSVTSCTVNVKFAPMAPGLRMGAVELLDGSGNLLATQMVSGNGQGPALAFVPGTQSIVNPGTYSLLQPGFLSQPKGATVDAAGDLYISDNGNQRVVKIPATGSASIVGSGLQYPQGLAVDGAGDLFIADNNLNAVVEVTPAGVQTEMSFGLAAQLGVAVDGAGDIYISDFTGSLVAEAPYGCTTSACTIPVYSAESGFHPVGLAVDAAGDLFVADFSDSPGTVPGKVVELPTGCGSSCQVTVGTGWYEPEAVAVDAAGDLFVGDELPQVVEVPAGCTVSACQITVSGILAYGVAVDGSGNVFLPDLDNNVVQDPNSNQVLIFNRSQAPSLSFATTNVGSTSTDSPQSFAIQNVGNQALDAISPGLIVNGANFVAVPGSGGPSDCSPTFILAPGADCNVSISFKPQNTNSPASSVIFTDNSFNEAPATQVVGLSGVALSSTYTIGGSVTGLVGSGLVLQDNLGDNLPISANGAFTFATAINTGNPYSVTVLSSPIAQNCAVTEGGGTVANANITSVLVTCTTIPSYGLSVTEIGSGSGTVTSSVGAISCLDTNGSISGICSDTYLSGSPVTLTASATGTSTFLGWGGACAASGTNPTCDVSVVSVLNATASFAQQNFGNVNVCPSGLSTPAPCSGTLTLTYNLAATTTIGVTQVVTQGVNGLDFSLDSGGTCTGVIAEGASCTVNVTFTPRVPGLRMGAVNLFDDIGNLLATTPIYGVGEAPAIAFGPGTQTALVGVDGVHAAREVALDGAGNMFIAENLNDQVVELPAGGGAQTPVGTGLSGPYGVALDGAGNVFIADTGNNRVVEVPAGGGSQRTVTSGLNSPLGITVDGAGNLFIADTDNNQVLELPASGGPQKTIATGLNNPNTVVVDSAGDLFIVTSSSHLVKIPAGGGASVAVGTGLSNPRGATVDAAGDVFIADTYNSKVVEVPAGCTNANCQTTVGSGFGYPWGVAVDSAGDVFVTDTNDGEIAEINRSQLPSLSFALTNVSSTSTDSPQSVSIQNVGNQTLTGSLFLSLGTNFLQNGVSNCSGGFALAPGSSCSESFSFTPQTTGYLTGTAAFSDNTLNLSSLVALQTVNLAGNGGINGQPVGVTVPNVVGLTQAAAASTITGAGLTLGTVSIATSPDVPSGSVAASNPGAGTQVSVGSAVRLLVSMGQPAPPKPNPLTFENNYFVTGDYASAGVTLRGHGVGGVATGTITIHDSTIDTSAPQGVPDGADIVDGFLYWETLENTAAPSGGSGTFDNYPITGQQIGSDLPYTDGGFSGTLRVYRADVNAYFPLGANGERFASGSFTVSLPDGGSALPLTEGASLVVIYRVLSPNFPLKAVVIYDGSAIPSSSTTQDVLGFYDAVGGAAGTGDNTTLFAAGGSWNNSSNSVSLGQSNQYVAPLNAGNAYAAVILSTPVNNSDNDGILDAWKAGPAAGDFYAGQSGYYDVKTGSWVSLPGALHGEKDLFVQLDYMCGNILASGACDPNEENLFPSPDSSGNDPLKMVSNAFAAIGIHLHLEIGNAVPENEDTCTDNTSTTPQQLCEFPSQPGVISWKNSLEFSKLWPRNLASCETGGDCSIRFPYGQKDSYHYVLFGHSLAIPAWNSRYGSLTSINVVSGVTTIVTADRGSGINHCPSRITIAGVLGNPSLNGIYNTTGCANAKTITVATPGVPNWSYPNTTLPEPVIGLTSGTVTSISGYSDLGGADSAISLGLWETAPNQDMSKRANVIAGTLFHEIGHTLGLSHGGLYYDTPGSYIPTFDVNCKPNYQSIMNYLFQLDGLGPNATVAFSNQQLDGLPQTGPAATLSLGSLGSVVDLTDASGNPATFPTSAWYSPIAPNSTASPATLHCDGTTLAGDKGYRVNGSISPIAPAWSNGQNITFDGVPYTSLRGYNDVANIDLRQVGATGGEFASLATVLSFGSSTAPLNVAAGGSVSLGAGGTVALGSGGTVTLGSGGNATVSSGSTITPGINGSVTLNNGGTATLSTGGTVTLGSGGTVALGSGGTVTLGSGGTITLGSGGKVALGSGGTVTLGSGGTITSSAGTVTIPSTGGNYTLPAGGGTIALGSGGTVALGSGGTVALGSGGTIALGSGGTVALGSGGTIALGSGGTIALGSGGTIALGSGGNVTLGSGGTIALGSGGTVALGSGGNVTLGSGGTVTLGSGGDLSLGSGGTVTLGSGGTVALGSGGTVALGSGGNVTLGSGGTIALGSGGTVTLVSGGTVTLGSGGTIALGSGGNVTVPPGGSYTIDSSGGTITLGSGGTVALGSGGTVALGSGGTITMGSGGTVTLGSGGTVTLGSGGVVALGSGGTVALGSGGIVALGSGGTVTLGSGGATTNEMDYYAANSVVRPPSSPTETPMSMVSGAPVVVNWTAPLFGVVATYTISRGSELYAPFVIGSVSGVNGNPPATTFTDTNPDVTSHMVAYTISTTLLPIPVIDPTPRQSVPSPPAVLTNDQTIVLGPPALPSSVNFSTSTLSVYATAESNGTANGLQVSFAAVSATSSCAIGNQSIDNATGISSATVTLNSPGSCTITASQSGAATYNAANPVSGTFTILPANSNTQSQTILFPQLPAVQYGGTFSLSASSSAGLQVTLATSGPCTLGGKTTGVGLCNVTASAPAGTVGNNTYSAASVSQSFNIYPAVFKVTATSPTITYGQAIPALTYTTSPLVNGDLQTAITGVPALSTTATAASNAGGYPITVSTGTLAAANYSFLYVNGTLTIQQANQAIIFTTNAPSSAAYPGSFTVAATGGASGNPVTFTSSGSCSNIGATYTMTSSLGACLVIADQAGNTNYSIAPTVTQTVDASGPAVAVSPSSIDFGTVTLGSITTKNITVTNVGSASVTINQPLLSLVQGGNSNEFVAVNLCLTPLATGKSCTITIAFVAGPFYTPQTATLEIVDNAPGSPQPVTLSALVLTPQIITFTTNPPASAAYKTSFMVAATGGASGNAVTFTSSGACTNLGATYTMNSSTGTCSVIANQAGNSTYSAATQVSRTVSATVAPQTITFTTNPPASAAYKTSFPVAATGGASGIAVTFTSSGACSNSGATYTMTASSGTCSVIANQAGNSNYSPATQSTQHVTAIVAPQAITFTTNAPTSAAYNTSFSVAATGGASGNAVKFTSSGACTNSGSTYKMTSGTGSCSVIANQAGNSNYSAAAQVTQTVTATQAAQAITFSTNPPAAAAYKSTFKVAATGGASGNAVTFTSSGACSDSGTTYTMTSGTGTCSVIANQAGNSNYAAATQVTKTVTATLAAQTITFTTNPPSTASNNSSFTVAATGGGSGNALVFTSSGVCTNSGATYKMTSATGTCSVIANQTGNSNYAAAAQVTKAVTAKK
jgi:sugar lactone lactonase YvrE